LAVFPEAKLFSGWNFPVKNEIQNWNPEFASHYGMAAGDHCGDATDMMPAPARRPPVAGQGCRTGRTATGCGHGQPATLPATGNAWPHGPATDTAGHGRTRTRQAGHREDVAKRRPGCGRN